MSRVSAVEENALLQGSHECVLIFTDKINISHNKPVTIVVGKGVNSFGDFGVKISCERGSTFAFEITFNTKGSFILKAEPTCLDLAVDLVCTIFEEMQGPKVSRYFDNSELDNYLKSGVACMARYSEFCLSVKEVLDEFYRQGLPYSAERKVEIEIEPLIAGSQEITALCWLFVKDLSQGDQIRSVQLTEYPFSLQAAGGVSVHISEPVWEPVANTHTFDYYPGYISNYVGLRQVTTNWIQNCLTP